MVYNKGSDFVSGTWCISLANQPFDAPKIGGVTFCDPVFHWETGICEHRFLTGDLAMGISWSRWYYHWFSVIQQRASVVSGTTLAHQLFDAKESMV